MSKPQVMNPRALAFLDEERSFAETFAKTSSRRVKFEKANDAWLLRFLPVEMGASKRWYVRHAQHWHNKKPITCPRGVAADYGGQPDAECPVCAMADQLNNEHDEKVSRAGYDLGATVTYITWCLVYQIDHGRGDIESLPLADVLKPYEFAHYKGSFDQLQNFFRRGYSEQRPLSVLDLESGCDFWVTKQKKGLAWDRQDAAPCLDADSYNDKNLDLIYSRIHEPRIVIPTEKELEVFARKAEASAFSEQEQPSSEARSGRNGRALSGDDADDAAGDDASSRRSGRTPQRTGRSLPIERAAEPVRPSRATSVRATVAEPIDDAEIAPEDAGEPQDADVPVDDDQVPGAEVPAQRAPAATRRPAAAAATQARPAAAARPAVDAVQEPEDAPPAPRQTAGTRRPAAATTAARPAAVSATSRPARAATASAASSVNEEEDPGVAEETRDPAEAAEAPLEEAEGAAPTEAPAAVAATPLKQRMLNRIRDGAPAMAHPQPASGRR